MQIQGKEVELQESRLTSERTMVQMMELTNEVNTKQDEVCILYRSLGGGVGTLGKRSSWRGV